MITDLYGDILFLFSAIVFVTNRPGSLSINPVLIALILYTVFSSPPCFSLVLHTAAVCGGKTTSWANLTKEAMYASSSMRIVCWSIVSWVFSKSSLTLFVTRKSPQNQILRDTFCYIKRMFLIQFSYFEFHISVAGNFYFTTIDSPSVALTVYFLVDHDPLICA